MVFPKHINCGKGLLFLAAAAACASGGGETIEARAAAPIE